jgi:hypothetical protein
MSFRDVSSNAIMVQSAYESQANKWYLPLQTLLCLPFDKLRTNGSMVLPLFSVVRFRARSAKTNNDTKKRSALPKAMIAFDTQPRKACM